MASIIDLNIVYDSLYMHIFSKITLKNFTLGLFWESLYVWGSQLGQKVNVKFFRVDPGRKKSKNVKNINFGNSAADFAVFTCRKMINDHAIVQYFVSLLEGSYQLPTM